MSLRFAGVVRRGEFRLDATVSAEPGEVLALLGPNGAGKSTLLRAVAGLIAVDQGRITLGERTLDDADTALFVPPSERRLGLVFQDHRLFPHLSVADNVAFGLRSQGVNGRSAKAESAGWLQRLGLTELAGRHPRDLSGGQAQRVALARALASRPQALLLDEPLAALDVQTRAQVQGELREHLGAFAGPCILVTHDPIEALLLAGRILVLEDGHVAQQGTPAEVTGRPATGYVARLVGVNLYAGTGRGNRVRLDDGSELVVPDAEHGRVLVAVRPSSLTVHTESPQHTSARNVWSGTVSSLSPLGDRIRLTVAGTSDLLADVTAAAVAELGLVPGRTVWLTAKATDLTVYPAP